MMNDLTIYERVLYAAALMIAPFAVYALVEILQM